MLINLPGSSLSISWSSILTVALVSIIFFVGVLSYAVKAQMSKVKTGREGMKGEVGVARTDIDAFGKVFLHGELWDARSEAPVRAGERVVVAAVEGMIGEGQKRRGELKMLPAYVFIFVVIIIILGMAIKILNEYERARHFSARTRAGQT